MGSIVILKELWALTLLNSQFTLRPQFTLVTHKFTLAERSRS